MYNVITILNIVLINFITIVNSLKVHLNTKKTKNKCTRSEIPLNMSFFVYIIPKETNILQIHIKKKRKWLKIKNLPFKIYIRIISIIPIPIQVLISWF
jgi:hypothetical protein